jgi:arsenite methyltransferase
MDRLNRFLAAQLRQPSGWFGALFMGRMLNRTNGQIIRRTLELLDPAPSDHVLDIGFGGGSGLARLATMLTSGKAVGVDISPEMMERAQRRFAREIASGRMQVVLGDVAQLPFPVATFDRVLTVNTIYFWAEVPRALAEIRRVLKPAGRAAIGLRSREKMQPHGVTRHSFRLFAPDEVVALMKDAGFGDVQVEHRDPDRWYDQVIVTGSR